jgi:hypothetical protein
MTQQKKRSSELEKKIKNKDNQFEEEMMQQREKNKEIEKEVEIKKNMNVLKKENTELKEQNKRTSLEICELKRDNINIIEIEGDK